VFLLSIDEIVKYFGDSRDLRNRKGWYYYEDGKHVQLVKFIEPIFRFSSCVNRQNFTYVFSENMVFFEWTSLAERPFRVVRNMHTYVFP
jgi:hypothetical protein